MADLDLNVDPEMWDAFFDFCQDLSCNDGAALEGYPSNNNIAPPPSSSGMEEVPSNDESRPHDNQQLFSLANPTESSSPSISPDTTSVQPTISQPQQEMFFSQQMTVCPQDVLSETLPVSQHQPNSSPGVAVGLTIQELFRYDAKRHQQILEEIQNLENSLKILREDSAYYCRLFMDEQLLAQQSVLQPVQQELQQSVQQPVQQQMQGLVQPSIQQQVQQQEQQAQHQFFSEENRRALRKMPDEVLQDVLERYGHLMTQKERRDLQVRLAQRRSRKKKTAARLAGEPTPPETPSPATSSSTTSQLGPLESPVLEPEGKL